MNGLFTWNEKNGKNRSEDSSLEKKRKFCLSRGQHYGLRWNHFVVVDRLVSRRKPERVGQHEIALRLAVPDLIGGAVCGLFPARAGRMDLEHEQRHFSPRLHHRARVFMAQPPSAGVSGHLRRRLA